MIKVKSVSLWLTFQVFSQGNIEFTTDGDTTQVKNQDVTKKIAELLKVDHDNVTKALCHRIIAAKGEVMEKQHSVSEATYGRDAFAKVRVFSFFL